MKPYQTEYKTTSTVIHHPLTGCSVSGCGQSFFKKKRGEHGQKLVYSLYIDCSTLCIGALWHGFF